MAIYTYEIHPRTPRLDRMMDEAMRMSRTLGHKPDMALPDAGPEDGTFSDRAALSTCRLCGRMICVDLEECDHPYGSGVTEPCDRRDRR